ncbi:Outer membrane protein TolC [Xylanibacter ruminicola]|uniref:Outer membrane protein TolC n=2 Tax=Xylanibacter ruminicola TaxID=839 RepID=A0A1H3ZNM3_XYLRU|nr:Outer membrane protein TolC [Xylanibacter ruminicola]
MMKKTFGVLLLSAVITPVWAQRILSLDSCRQMALRNNKQLGISKLKQDVAENARKSARTKYLPHVSAIGTYEFTSEEISILNDGQKAALGGLGTAVGGTLQSTLGSLVATLPPAAQMQMAQDMAKVTEGLNQRGQNIVDAFRTDTRNVFAGSVVVTQPVFMGGAIVALNKMADITTEMAKNSLDARRQATLYQIDQAYWQVVSLHHKKALAESYLELVKKFDSDVHKMIDEGVATRSDGLSVDVKVNEAEMTLTKVNDGLVLSRMLLNQLCGLPLNESVILQDEQADNIAVVELTPQLDVENAVAHRPELKMLQNTVDLSKQATNVLKAGNLPQVALMGGYAVSNPNVLNGFEKKFAGFWHLGVIVRVPIWNWGDVMYKVRASKGATAIATLELDEAREKIELQVNQTTFKVDEANKKLTMAQKNIQRADENLRTANLGFQEGVISPTVVMEAQTAWLQAQSQKIDAEIDVKLSQVDLQKALGTLE